MNIKNSSIKGRSIETFLGVTVDINCTFAEHINELSKKGNQKLHTLASYAKYMSIEAFVVSQFKYCPLGWMLPTKQLSNWINSLHEKDLTLTYQNKNCFLMNF